MKYDDLEKTKELFEIDNDIPTPIANIEMEGVSKNTLTDEFTLGLTDKESDLIKDNISKKETNSEEGKKKKSKDKKEKKSLKEKWQGLTKKQKILTIIILCLILIVIIILVLVLVLNKKDKKPDTEVKEPDKPVVIIEEENYTYKDGYLSLIDKNKNELGTYECKNKDKNLCYVAYFSNEDEFDGPKNVYTDESIITRRTPIFNDKYVFIYDNNSESTGALILYNISEQTEVGTYDLVKGFSDSNYVILKNNMDKYGAIEINDDGPKEKIKFTFDYLGAVGSNSKIVAKTNNKYFIYNKDGKLESKGLSYPIKNYNNSYIVADNNGEYLYDYKSNLVIDGAYDYISLDSNYVGLVKDNYLYIKDYKNNKYNEEGIELFNNYYNKTNIYNEDNVLSSTKESFSINVIEDNIEVTYINKNDKEKTVNISTNEGKLSSSLANLNYFNGKLYFYKDEDKKNLLGTYSCNNKNSVNKDTKELSNCLVASENNGWIPILNERYVFILDSLDANNKTIMLYDLKNNKTLSRYANVYTSLNPTESKITFAKSNNLYIIAQNKSNRYGVIKLEEEVKSAIPFNYSKIDKLKDYYLAETSSKAYVLLNNNGEEVTEKYGQKIVDYRGNYLKIEINDKYNIYDFKGNEIGTDYLYADLQDDYYAVITSDKKIDIKKYTDTSFGLTNPIDIGNTEDYNNVFEISKSASNYIIKLKATGQIINIPLSGENNTAVSDE